MPATDAAAIVAEARTWVGTPFGHQGRLKGHRVDCIGLVWRVGEAAGQLYVDPDRVARFLGYGRAPNPKRMGEGLATFLRPLDTPRNELAADGSIAWMEWERGMPMHVGIVASYQGRRTLIHAFEHVGRVVEHGFDAEWRGRVASWWAYPGAGAADGPHREDHRAD